MSLGLAAFDLLTSIKLPHHARLVLREDAGFTLRLIISKKCMATPNRVFFGDSSSPCKDPRFARGLNLQQKPSFLSRPKSFSLILYVRH